MYSKETKSSRKGLFVTVSLAAALGLGIIYGTQSEAITTSNLTTLNEPSLMMEGKLCKEHS